MECPHCGNEINLVTCAECGCEEPEETIRTCETCMNTYCEQHIEHHECEDGQTAKGSRKNRS